MLQSNGYPINFIKQATRPPRGTTTASNEPEDAPPTIWRSFPTYRAFLSQLLDDSTPTMSGLPISPTLFNLVRVPTLQRRKVIYQIPRLKENRGSVRRHGTNSCLALHCMDTGHTFNWQDTRILGSANPQRAREAIEALHSGENSVNQFMQLDPRYRSMHLQQ